MRAFIVGNGPSLTRTPLELMNGEVSFGVNAVHLIYNQTSWRPTDLVIGDLTQGHRDWIHEHRQEPDIRLDRFFDIIRANGGANIHIRGNYRVWADRLLKNDDIDYFSVCTHHSMGLDDRLEDKAPKSWHFPQICRWGGGVSMAIQLAARAGYKPLYLVGCDLGFRPGTANHFDPNYSKPYTQAKADALNAVIGHSHELAANQWEIYNATYGGDLEAYPRVGFSELFL